MPTQEEVNAQLKLLLGEDLKVISYKWLARHFGLPCNVAKQALFAFLEQHRGKVKATYLLAGWTTTEPRQHVVQLVDSAQLTTSRSSLDPVTSMHVYSLQPTQPKDSSELWNHDAIQTSELFQQLRLGKVNCLADNRWSAVQSSEAKHDPNLAKRAPKPAAGPSSATEAAAPSKAADKKPAANSAAGQIAGIMTGSTANKGGVAAASVAVRGSGSSSVRDSAEAPALGRDSVTTATAPALERDSVTTATAPAAAAPLPSSTAPAVNPAGGKKKGGSRLANMWSKAPAVKEKPKQASKGKAAAPTAPAVDADAALRSAQQASSNGSDSDADDFLPVKRAVHQRTKRIEEEEEGSPVKAPAKRAKKATPAGKEPSRQAALESEEDEEEGAEPSEKASKIKQPKKGAAKPKATKAGKKAATAGKRSAAKAAQSDEDIPEADIEVSIGEDDGQEEQQSEEGAGKASQGKAKGKGKRAAANCPTKPGHVKAGSVADGPKRRKVMKTTINDRGEEVTEEVWEDSQQASPEPDQASPAASAQPHPQRAASEPPQASPAASPEKSQQDDALKEQPGKQNVGKPSKAVKPSAAAAKRASGKAAAKDQRGIMSFFGKK